MEIEKKFLVDERNIPNLSEFNFCEIEQGYLNIKPDPIIRIRKKDNDYIAEPWFKKDITGNMKYINSRLSLLSNIKELKEDEER